MIMFLSYTLHTGRVLMILFLITGINFHQVYAQLYVHGDVLTVQSGARLVVNDSLRVQKAGSIDANILNNGKIILKGDFKMEPGTELNGEGNICFAGNNQRLRMNGIPLPRLELQGNDSVILEDDVTVTDSMILLSGFLHLGSSDLSIDSSVHIAGGSTDSYIRVNGTGRLQATVGSSSRTLPIGRNPYLPIVLSNGGGAVFTLGVTDGVYENPETLSNEQTTNAVTETWSIQASEAVSNVIIQVGWEQSQEASGFDRNNCNLAYWQQGSSTAWNTDNNSAASGTGPYFQTRTLNLDTNLYFLGVGSSGSALPVELIKFSARWLMAGSSALLEWHTVSEENNSHFELQRSINGFVFEHIGTINGMGTTLNTTSYQFTDHRLPKMGNSPFSRNVFYRLKQVDFDGAYSYSKIVALQFDRTSSAFIVYPNPSNSPLLHVSEPGTYTLRTMDGRTLNVFAKTDQLDVSQLPTGAYVISNQAGVTCRYFRR